MIFHSDLYQRIKEEKLSKQNILDLLENQNKLREMENLSHYFNSYLHFDCFVNML